MFKKHKLWIWTIVLFHCFQQISSDDNSDKTKREVWSSGHFNTFSDSDKNDKSFGPMSPFSQVFSAIDSLGLKFNGNVKSTVEFWPPDMDRDKFYKLREEESAFPLTSWFNFKPLVKETKKEPEISYPIIVNDNYNKNSNDYAEITVKESNNDDNYSTKSLKDYTTKPGVIRNSQKYFKHEHYTVKPEIHEILSTSKPEVIDNVNKYDIKYYKSTIKRPEVAHELGYEQDILKNVGVIYENSFTAKPYISSLDYENAAPSPTPLNNYSPTEQTNVNFDDAIINVGPVMFPNIGLTEKRTHEFITYVPTTASSPRANKKRKLKKKVKTSSITQFSKEKHITQTPPSLTALVVNSSFDVIAETSSEYTPIKEIIDNDSIHYTDIISNLSNLTELSFNSYNGTVNNHHHFMQQSDHHQKSIKNIIYSSKIAHSTTPFIIKVEPETQDDVIDNNKSSTTEIPVVTLSSSLPLDMKKLESSKDSLLKTVEKKIKQKVNNDNEMSNFKIIVESSSPMSTISNSIDEKYFTTTVSTAKKLNRSRFGIRNFKSRVQSQSQATVKDQTSSTASFVASTTVKSIPKRIKSSISTKQVLTSSEKPINDYMMINVKSSTTARYYTPKLRTRHQNSRIK